MDTSVIINGHLVIKATFFGPGKMAIHFLLENPC